MNLQENSYQNMLKVFLREGREKSVLSFHPWVFSGAIKRVEGNIEAGQTVEVISAKGKWLCRAAYNPASNIRARIWTWDESESIDKNFFERRIANAIRFREDLNIKAQSQILRLINAESDFLPGLIVDQYGDILVAQILSAGAERHKNEIIQGLLQVTGIDTIYERSDVDVRLLEGLSPRCGPICGELPSQPLIFEENSLKFLVDIAKGHKTGFYLDQRDNRRLIQAYVKGKEVLNCFCYTGGFTVNALAGGARNVTSVDSSIEALTLAERNVSINGFRKQTVDYIEGDVFKILRQMRDSRQDFDVIVLDPPKFAPTASQVQRAARGYKDINLLAFKLLRPGGILFTFSCSGGVSAELFQKIVASAALDANVHCRVIMKLTQAPDHPFGLHFPEGQYLKGLICGLPS